MIINKPHLVTHMDVWTPRYKDKYRDYGEYVALLHKKKVDFATGVIIVTFTKAKHLQGQRFCIKRSDAMQHEVGTNGSADMYIIPMSHFEQWETAQEIHDLAMAAFDD